ncbi:MAG: DUF2786 domain-containing protein [Acidimicrobiales bacterium]|jgi:hypothetical protein|nr:DUF2786 domain-containing protein [Acidimicrobiales bacterium]
MTDLRLDDLFPPATDPTVRPDRRWDRATIARRFADVSTALTTRHVTGTHPDVDALVEQWDARPDLVSEVVADVLARQVATLWNRGWQPAHLPRAVDRGRSSALVRLTEVLVGIDARRYRHDPAADPRWMAQVPAPPARTDRRAPGELLLAWASRHDLTSRFALGQCLLLHHRLQALPDLELLLDPPDRWGTGPRRTTRRVTGEVDEQSLQRVRALLAKAESTTFPAEAEAFTAKAQQLMTRLSIDRAMLDERTRGDAPTGLRVTIDDPYAKAKYALLSEVADANDCRAIWSSGLGFATVYGFDPNLDTTDLLFTSLLVQASAAMLDAGRRSRHRQDRSRSFRQSFLVAFGFRIGERLREAAATAVADASAEHGRDLLPVVVDRRDRVDEEIARRFPDLGSMTMRVSDSAGAAAGWLAADRADLSAGAPLPRG